MWPFISENAGPLVSHRAYTLLGPLVALALILGCPKKKEQSAPDAAPSVSAPVATSSAPAPSVSTPPINDYDDAGEEDAAMDALDGEVGDATDASAKGDAYDDAPLLGAKTYPDENPIKGIRRITSNGAKVHKAPKDNNVIALLQRGTEVSLVAEIFDWYRVRYNDPNTNVRRQGWIYVTTFAGPRMKNCPVGWTHHDQDGGWCDKECTKNTDCKALKGYKCSGTLCFYASDEPIK
jgi:hypothetical protein